MTNERTNELSAFFSDFADCKPPSRDESNSEEEELDGDVQDTIFAHMFFTSTQSQKVENDRTDNVSHNQAKTVSVVLDENTSLKEKTKKLTREEVKAVKRLKRKKRRLLRKSQPVNSSSDCSKDDSHSQQGSRTKSLSMTQSLSAAAEKRAKGTEAAKNKLKAKGSHSADAIVISDEQSAPEVITISSDHDADSDFLLFDTLEDMVDRDSKSSESSNGMELCDHTEVDNEGICNDWAICKKDQLGRDAYERLYEKDLGDRPGRYYNDKAAKKCSNCKQRGHTLKNCPWPKRHQVCHVCAGLNHTSAHCPYAMCSWCYQPQHRGRPCSGPCGRLVDCGRCFMPGHHASICPDQWRQFHNTNYSDDQLVTLHPTKQRNPTKVYCYNCSSPGHYGFECTKTRPRGCYRPHTPLIARYDLEFWPPLNIELIRQRLGLVVPGAPPVSKSSEHYKHTGHHQHRHRHSRASNTANTRSKSYKNHRKHSRSYNDDDYGAPSVNGQTDYHGGSYKSDIQRRHSTGQPDDFPRMPLLPHCHGDDYSPVPSHPFPPTQYTPSHHRGLPSSTHTPLLPHPHHRRFSDITDTRSYDRYPEMSRDQYHRSHDQDRQSHNYERSYHHEHRESRNRDRGSFDRFYTPPHKRHRTEGDEYYTSSRGFRGSPQTARMLDNHVSRHGHFRY